MHANLSNVSLKMYHSVIVTLSAEQQGKYLVISDRLNILGSKYYVSAKNLRSIINSIHCGFGETPLKLLSRSKLDLAISK